MLFLLTQHCDMECPHCLSDATIDGEHASKRTVDRFVWFAKKMKTTRIGISGGEATNHPAFYPLFNRIVRQLPTVQFVLMSNGAFLRNDNLTHALARLQIKYQFAIQICSIPGLYKDYKEIVGLYRHKHRLFPNIHFVDGLYFLEKTLGRAARNDLTQYETGNQRIAPGCWNLYSACRTCGSLKTAINLLDRNSTYTWCKPMIDATGNVHPGESISCPIIGNIHTSTMGQIYNALRSGVPCGKCGTSCPPLPNLTY